MEAYEFLSRGRTVVVLWSRSEEAPALQVPDGMRALDLMGAELPAARLVLDEVPIYLVAP